MTHRQQLRKEVHLQLYGANPLAVPPVFIARTAERAGIACTVQDAIRECEFLAGQGFAERIEDQSSGETRYKITSKGVLEYERNQ